MQQIKNILICGAPISENKGGAALVYGTIKAFRRIYPDSQFTLLSMNYASDQPQEKKYGISVVQSNLWQLPLGFLAALIWRLFKIFGINLKFLINKSTILREYTNADFILNITGIGFHDFFGKLVIIKHALWILPATILKLKIIPYSQSFGPFKSHFNRFLAKLCLSRTNTIVVRGDKTKQYLKEIGITASIHVCPDMGFLLDPISKEDSGEIFEKEGISDLKRPLIGISVNRVIDQKLKGSTNDYILKMGGILDYLSTITNGTLVFIPHDTHDVDTANKIINQIGRKESLFLISKEYLAEEFKGIIGQCDIFIGSRFHSLVASLSMCVPTLAIGWSHKYHEVMRTAKQENFILDFNTMTAEELKHKIDQLLSDKELIRGKLQSLAPDITNQAYTGAKFVANSFN